MGNFFKHKMRGKSPGVIAGWVILGVIGIAGLAILFGFVIMWLWNWLMPELFGLAELTYWQAVGIFILSKILLGSCGGSGGDCNKSSKQSECESDTKSDSKGSFSKWIHYDTYWKEEGEQAYNEYVEQKDKPQTDDTAEQ
ncbi:MAG: hypothetical protein PSN34_10790 [Urechidicola sp.]|nr:hypothetical protein [Urechidicola sp.]